MHSISGESLPKKVLYATLAFPPAGIFFGWRNPAWSRNTKIGWTIVSVLIFAAWGGVLGQITGSSDASLFELFNVIATAVAAFFIFTIWTHPSWRISGKVACTLGSLLALGAVGSITGTGRSGPAGLKHGMLSDEVVAIMGEPDWELRSPAPGHDNAVMQQRWSRGTGPMGFDPEKSTTVLYEVDGPPPWRVKMILGKGGKSLREAAEAMP